MVENENYVLPRDRDPEFFQIGRPDDPADQVVIFRDDKDTLPLLRNTFMKGYVVGRWVEKDTGKVSLAVDPGKSTSEWDDRIPQKQGHSWPMFELHSAHIMKLAEWNTLVMSMKAGIGHASRFLRSGSTPNGAGSNATILQAFQRTCFGTNWSPLLPQERDSVLQPAEMLLSGDPAVIYVGDDSHLPPERRKTFVEGFVTRTDAGSVYVQEYGNGLVFDVPYRSPFVFGRWTYERLRQLYQLSEEQNQARNAIRSEHGKTAPAQDVIDMQNSLFAWINQSIWPHLYGYSNVDRLEYYRLMKASFAQIPPVCCDQYFQLT